ncbi:hypothetical protein FB451DRAFT_1173053 [Mycena latifolia]|nr:hypothetical protein FB451DRAFT_1173053 [Mycena latifolia]
MPAGAAGGGVKAAARGRRCEGRRRGRVDREGGGRAGSDVDELATERLRRRVLSARAARTTSGAGVDAGEASGVEGGAQGAGARDDAHDLMNAVWGGVSAGMPVLMQGGIRRGRPPLRSPNKSLFTAGFGGSQLRCCGTTLELGALGRGYEALEGAWGDARPSTCAKSREHRAVLIARVESHRRARGGEAGAGRGIRQRARAGRRGVAETLKHVVSHSATVNGGERESLGAFRWSPKATCWLTFRKSGGIHLLIATGPIVLPRQAALAQANRRDIYRLCSRGEDPMMASGHLIKVGSGRSEDFPADERVLHFPPLCQNFTCSVNGLWITNLEKPIRPASSGREQKPRTENEENAEK